MTKTVAKMNAQEQVELIQKRLGYQTFERPPKVWLDTGSQMFNSVVGSKEKGIAYGKILTFAGMPSSGKTLLAAFIAGLAQGDGAQIGWVDVENSFDPTWVKIHGLDPGQSIGAGFEKVALFQPELGIFGKKKKNEVMRLQAAEELFASAEAWMVLQRELDPKCKLCVVVDSTTSVEPAEELEAGLTGQNMRTKMLAPFLNLLSKRWKTVAFHTNAIVIFIAQLRKNPGQLFGNPEYIPGGNGVLFYPSVICKVRRTKGGLIVKNGRPIGVKSTITNVKNKAGEGSVEGLRCGFKAAFHDFDWRFMSAEKLENEKDDVD